MKRFKLFLISFFIFSTSVPALAEIELERMYYGFLDGVIYLTCDYYKQGYLPEEIAKKDLNFWYSRIDKLIKNKDIKLRLIAKHNKDENLKCKNLLI